MDATRTLKIDIYVAEATDAQSLHSAFQSIIDFGAAGLAVGSNPRFFGMRKLLIGLTRKHRLATVFNQSDYTKLGGLISYGTDVVEVYRQVGIYAARILNGAKPQELPIHYPKRFDS